MRCSLVMSALKQFFLFILSSDMTGQYISPCGGCRHVHAGGMFLLRQGCPNYSAWAKCSPPSIFDWPISKTKTRGDCGPQIIFVLKVSHFFELARHRTAHMPPQQSPWPLVWKRRDQLCCHFPNKDRHGRWVAAARACSLFNCFCSNLPFDEMCVAGPAFC